MSILLVFGEAAAQTLPAVPVATEPALLRALSTPIAADTVQAIHRMFARHRRAGLVLTFGAVGADLALAGAAGSHDQSVASSPQGGSYSSLERFNNQCTDD